MAGQHLDLDCLLTAWHRAKPGSEERHLVSLALADASEEMGDDWSAYIWREVLAGRGVPASVTEE